MLRSFASVSVRRQPACTAAREWQSRSSFHSTSGKLWTYDTSQYRLSLIRGNQPNHHNPFISLSPNIKFQRRNYIFLPSSFADASKLLKSFFVCNQQRQSANKRLMVKLRYHWQDTMHVLKTRMEVLKQIQKEQRTLANQRALAARIVLVKRSDKFSRLLRDMRRKVGQLSHIALSKGKQNLISHYNAKKRIRARRKLARQLARATMIEKWKVRFQMDYDSMKALADDVENVTWRRVTITEPSDPSWFDGEGYPLTSRDPETGRFVNPWLSESSNGKNGIEKFLRWKVGGKLRRMMETLGMFGDNDASISMSANFDEKIALHSPIENNKSLQQHAMTGPEQANNDQMSFENETCECIRLTWIGHSSTVVTFPGGFTVLTDPHFSNYAGPVRRAIPPAIGVADLPEVVDCVLISHDHMDHLDYWSILELVDSNKVCFWVVPLGIKSWLIEKVGIPHESIVELEWWDQVYLSKSIRENSAKEKSQVMTRAPVVDKVARLTTRMSSRREISEDANQLIITCAPAQHWCSRTPFDRNKRLWCSFSIHASPAQLDQTTTGMHSFYFAGDTGLPLKFPLHHQIGDRLGPFDLSAIPIGAYEPNWFMREAHCNPTEAVKIHQALRSRRSVAIHFDTFNLSDEPMDEPPNLLSAEVRSVNKEIVKMVETVVSLVDKNDGIVTETQVRSTMEDLVEVIPPLVDFAVIKQGQCIDSQPKEVAVV